MTDTDPYFFTLETAYWKWHKTKCPFDRFANPKEERQWRKDNPFPFDGKLWTRSASGMRSNSGKTISGWDVYFRADDGTAVTKTVDRNRTSDPKRNWGLGRE